VQLDCKAASWQVINDDVMGGLSLSAVERRGPALVFRGQLSLENNGGFASTRCSIGQPLADIDGFRLTVRGDGRQYQFRLRSDASLEGIAWRADFATDGSMQVIELPLGAFVPVWRGREVEQAGSLDAAQIRLLGFMLADRRAGPFRLEVHGIEALGAERPPVSRA
jgi:NADH dehydrogenase [ubiquinone] 1 alpha subcomplex assembly factor 1